MHLIPSIIAALLLSFCTTAHAGRVVAIGTFAADADASTTVVESDVGAMMLAIVDVAEGQSWQVHVAAGGLQAPDMTRVWIRRAGEGAGQNDVVGGKLYRRVTKEPVLLFQGEGPRSSVPLQLRVTGLKEDYPGVVLSSLDYTLRIIVSPPVAAAPEETSAPPGQLAAEER